MGMRFLSSKGQEMTLVELRKAFAEIDFDKSRGISFIEYLLHSEKKTVEDLFDAGDPLPADLRAEINANLVSYQEAMAEERTFTDKMAELEETIAAGGVKANIAKAELEALKNKYSGEKARLEKIKLAAEKSRRASQKKAQDWLDQAAAKKAAQLAENLAVKEKAEAEAEAAAKAARAEKKAALNSMWENK